MNESRPTPRARYLELIRAEPTLFLNPGGSVFRILSEPGQIDEAERTQRSRLTDRGRPADWATVGVVYEDQYVMVVRDAVEFPDRAQGTYIRILSKTREAMGAAVLPILGDQILLIRHFRHATRSFHWEIPRGFSEANETGEIAGARELREEIGVAPLTITALGYMHTNTGLLEEYVCLLAATIDDIGEFDKAEAVSDHQLVSMPDLARLLIENRITDSFTLCAILLAQQKGIPPLSTLSTLEHN